MIYQDSLDNHEVIIMKEDSDNIATRKGDVDSHFSLFTIGKSMGYYVRDHHLSDVFLLGGVGASSVGETPNCGIDYGL